MFLKPKKRDDWLTPFPDVDKILAPVEQPTAPLRAAPDITRLSNTELMQHYWTSMTWLTYAQDQLGLAKAALAWETDEMKLFEVRFKHKHMGLPAARIERLMAAEPEWQRLKRELTKKDAFRVALDNRVEAYYRQSKVLSRELSRRGIEAEAVRKGL